MSLRWFCYAFSLACAGYLTVEALSPPLVVSKPSPPRSPLPPPAPFTSTKAMESDAALVVDQALDKLRGIEWLQVKVWQRCLEPRKRFDAESQLTLGPNQCAHMKMKVRSGKSEASVAIVCDGRSLAEIREPAPQEAVSEKGRVLLPLDNTRARDELLRGKGVAGPMPVLQHLKDCMASWRGVRGLWQGQEVVQLQGTPRENAQVMGWRRGETRWTLFLDAATLWPVRLECWSADGGAARLLLEMEYREAKLNCPLSPAECERVFSYSP